MGFSTRSRASVLFLAALAVVLMATACSSGGIDRGSSVPPSPQQLFSIQLVSDIKSLDRGVLLYQVPGTLNTGAQAYLSVEVADIGKGANGGSPWPAASNWVLYPQDVPTGGVVGLTATCEGLKCAAQSQERQAVPSFESAASWFWHITAQNPGVAHIYLDATTYDLNSDVVLHQTEPPIEITVLVSPTPGYWLTRVGNWLKALVGFVGFAALLALAQGIRRWRTRRKTRAAEPEEGKEPDEDKMPEHAGSAPAETSTSEVGAVGASPMVPATAVEGPLTPSAALSSGAGTGASPDRSSRDAVAAVLLSAGITSALAGQTKPGTVYLGQRMLYEKGTPAFEDLNPVDNAGYLRRMFLHAIFVALVWTLGTTILLAIGAIFLFAFSFVSLYTGALLILTWSIVMACVFWLRKLPSQLAAWNFLADGKAGLAQQVFGHVAWAFNRRRTPVDSWSVRRLPAAGGHSHEVLEVQDGIFHGLVSCLASGNDLYIGWTLWLYLSPARWLMLWLRQFLWWHHRQDRGIYQSLRFDRVRALREALHGATQEGMDVAAGQLAV